MPLQTNRPSALQGDITTLSFDKIAVPDEVALPTGLHFLPEWYPQSAVQISWPHEATDWAPMLGEVTRCYLALAYAIASRQPLLITVPDPAPLRRLLEEQLPTKVVQRIRIVACPTNDTWVRDYGYLTVKDAEGFRLLDFRFNGWGGKFEASLDNAVNRQIASLITGRRVDCDDYELEGGSVETDGEGTLLTTARCLCNANRNGGLTEAECEAVLSERLGVSRFLWLHHGYLAGDDTDSHIDTLARLCPDHTIVYVGCDDPSDEHFAELQAMEEELRAFRTPDGRPYRLLRLPWPEPCFDPEGERLPATYANYLVLNDAVLYPTYNQPATDLAAAEVLAKAFPSRSVVGVDCRPLIHQHGSLHCATMQYPRTVLNLDL